MPLIKGAGMRTGLSVAGGCFAFLEEQRGTGISLAGWPLIKGAGMRTGLSIAGGCLAFLEEERGTGISLAGRPLIKGQACGLVQWLVDALLF